MPEQNSRHWLEHLSAVEKKSWYYAGFFFAIFALILLVSLFIMKREANIPFFHFTVACQVNSNAMASIIVVVFIAFFALFMLFLGVLFEHFEHKKRFHKSRLIASRMSACKAQMAWIMTGVLILGTAGCVLVSKTCN